MDLVCFLYGFLKSEILNLNYCYLCIQIHKDCQCNATQLYVNIGYIVLYCWMGNCICHYLKFGRLALNISKGSMEVFNESTSGQNCLQSLFIKEVDRNGWRNLNSDCNHGIECLHFSNSGHFLLYHDEQ